MLCWDLGKRYSNRINFLTKLRSKMFQVRWIKINSLLKAFIFDMDGVLTDTVEYHYRSWQRLASDLKIPFSKKDNEKLLGLSRSDSLKIFLKGKQVSPLEFQQLLQKKNDYFLALLQDFSPANLLPGVRELLLQLKNAGYKMAVASSSRNTSLILKRLEITAFFDAVSDSNTVAKAKPAPDLFLDAARRLMARPEECVVFEDSVAGVEAGRRAEMLVVGVGAENLVGRAHLRYPSMAQVDLNQILTYRKR